jgi:hypothetical protein
MSPAGLLAAAEFPSDRYRLAAATGPETVPVNIVIIRNGRVREIRPVTAEIMLHRISGGKLSLGGRVQEGKELEGETWAHAVLRVAGKPPVEAEVDWDATEGQFLAGFDAPDGGAGILSLAVFCHQNASDDDD